MKEIEGVQNLYHRLCDIYGSSQVELEPTLGNSLRPDLIVYDTDDQPLLVVEYKKSLSYRRGSKGFDQLQRYLTEADCQYGALVTPAVEYIFEWKQSSGQVETSLGGFPNESEGPVSSRSIQSRAEASFLLSRVAELSGEIKLEHDDDLCGVPGALLRKLHIDKKDIDASDLLTGELNEELIEIDRELVDRYNGFNPQFKSTNQDISDENLLNLYQRFSKRILQTVFNVFQGYDLSQTDEDVVPAFEYRDVHSATDAEGYQTLPGLVDAIIELAEIERGDTVLDPAAGMGGLARRAATYGADSYGIEINQNAIIAGILLNELADQEVTYQSGDFLSLSQNHLSKNEEQKTLSDISTQKDDVQEDGLYHLSSGLYDHIVLDPPAIKPVSADILTENYAGERQIRVEEAFIAQSLQLLNKGGTLVTLVPKTILDGEKTQPFREYLLSDFDIEAIITFDADVFSGAESKIGLLKIRNNRQPGSEQDIVVERVEKASDERFTKSLQASIDSVLSGSAETISVDPEKDRTLLPSQIEGQKAVVADIYEEYDTVVRLEDVATEIIGGISSPDFSEESEDMIPYLSPKNLDEQEELEMIPRNKARITATESDILLKIKGDDFVVHQPTSTVAPSSDWGVISFDSETAVDAYLKYFNSKVAENSVAANRKGSIVPYVTISSLRDLPVPALGPADENGDDPDE
jgi:2-polyprenyl-3-methyl-5-hydroxy-6-metoxy-1,4-benzoquinol methylase